MYSPKAIQDHTSLKFPDTIRTRFRDIHKCIESHPRCRARRLRRGGGSRRCRGRGWGRRGGGRRARSPRSPPRPPSAQTSARSTGRGSPRPRGTCPCATQSSSSLYKSLLFAFNTKATRATNISLLIARASNSIFTKITYIGAV